MRSILAAAGALLLAACASQNAPTPAAPSASPAAAATKSSSGFDVANLDRNVSACDDFYQFANGGWMKANPIPPAYSRWGSFYVLDEQNQQKMRAVLEEAAAKPGPAGTDRQKVGDFFAACMNSDAIDRAGVAPLAADLQRIELLRSPAELPQLLAILHAQGTPAVFNFGSLQDLKDTEQVVAGVNQGGLGLPDRDYYTKDDPRSKEIRARYVQHIARMLQLGGEKKADATRKAGAILDLETRLARASMTNVELRDPNATYNKLSLADVQTLTPAFSWSEYLAALKTGTLPSLIIGQPRFLEQIQREIATTPIDTWREYLRWHLVNSSAPYLSGTLEQADFDFYGRFLEGKKEMLPRWKRCAAATDAKLGEALGRIWSERYFPATAKNAAMEMVRNIEAALREDITTLSWMGPETRTQALAKLDAFGLKIGYPEKWRDYTSLSIDRASYLRDVRAANRFESARDAGKIGRAVDRTEWLMSPPTVNAYNNPPMNEIVFPAGILQPPFYDPNADEAYNYGGIGAVIGHEIIHGFDDQGRQFDLKGNLADWWSAEDKARFLERAKCVSGQFSSFDVGNGLRMNGELVLGESLADLGGVQIAYAAYKKSQEGRPAQTIDGFTPDQRFFLGWAQVWSENSTPEFDRLLVTTDPHPIPRFRVNGPLSNMPEFAAAFGCKPAQKMVRAEGERCNVW